MIHDAAARGFDRAADAYERGRPTFPDEAVDRLLAETHVDDRSAVLELGAGTGKLTALLLARGVHVVAVEPVAGMRRVLVERQGPLRVLDGTAEAIPLGDASVDAAIVAQAFHWFDGPRALAEIHRVLRPGGRLGLIWNRRDERVPWVARLTAIVDVHRGDVPRYALGDWRVAFDETILFDPLQHAEYGYDHAVPPEGVVDRVASVSFISALPDEERERVFGQVRELVATSPETRGRDTVVVPYLTDVFWTERREPREL